MAKKRPDAAAWLAARHRWEEDTGLSFGDVASELGITRAAVHKRARDAADPWVRTGELKHIAERAHLLADRQPSSEAFRPKVDAKVDGAATGKVDASTAPDVIADAEVLRSGIIDKHRAEWQGVRRILETADRMMTEATSKSKRNDAMTIARFGKTMAEATALMQDREAKAWGIDRREAEPPIVISREEF